MVQGSGSLVKTVSLITAGGTAREPCSHFSHDRLPDTVRGPVRDRAPHLIAQCHVDQNNVTRDQNNVIGDAAPQDIV